MEDGLRRLVTDVSALALTRRILLGGLAASLPPMSVRADQPRSLELPTSDGRTCRVSVWPPAERPRGTILFSHGALSSPWKYAPLTQAWAGAGYEILAPLHVDSADHPDTARYPGFASWPARIEDMRAVARHVGARDYVAAGHSYGALVALTLGGAEAVAPKGVALPLRDPHARAVIAFSPPGAAPGLIERQGYGSLAVPALIETGTLDVPKGSKEGWEQHLLAYDAAPPGGDRYALVLDGVDHYFGGAICNLALPGPPQSEPLGAAVDVSKLFLKVFNEGEPRSTLDDRLREAGPVRLSRK